MKIYIVIIMVSTLSFKLLAQTKNTIVEDGTNYPVFYTTQTFSKTEFNEKRFALVIAVANYKNIIPLPRDRNDAEDMTVELNKAGFDVMQVIDPTKSEVDKAINDARKYYHDNNYDVALVYFSGHGATVGNLNMLMPADASFQSYDLPVFLKTSFMISDVVWAFNQPQTKVCLSFVDACRSYDYVIKSPQMNSDMANLQNKEEINLEMGGRSGVIVSTTSGTSSSGSCPHDRNSLFTCFLLKTLQDKPKDHNQVASIIAKKMRDENQKQIPIAKNSPTQYNFKWFGVNSIPPVIEKLVNDIVVIDSGLFIMGCTSEQSKTCDCKAKYDTASVLVNSFGLSKFEVTVAQFEAFITATGYITDAERSGYSYLFVDSKLERANGINWRCDGYGKIYADGDKIRFPVTHVSWNDVDTFCKWLSKATDKRFRLPTEAEWEYAARSGGKRIEFSWGNGAPTTVKGGNVADVTAHSKYKHWTYFSSINDGYVFSSPVGLYGANDLGLYDLSGNVSEWCNDWYGEYSNNTMLNPKGPEKGEAKVFRGCSWGGTPWDCCVSSRFRAPVFSTDSLTGFRLALDL